MISADKAIPLGLLINELVTNAAKHAYPHGSGEIHVTGEQRDGALHVEVLDQGNRPAEGFRYRPAAGKPRLQGHQESSRSTRRTHHGVLKRTDGRGHPTGRAPGPSVVTPRN